MINLDVALLFSCCLFVWLVYMLYGLIKPLLFSLDAEKAHHLSLKNLAKAGCMDLPLPFTREHDPVELMGLQFPNRVGLAAGFDKNAEAVLGLQKLGFGFLELGTVTPLAQEGNPKPRLFRLPQHHAVINRMGFNNAGIDPLVWRLNQARATAKIDVPLGVNIGKNKLTTADNAVDDYVICLKKAAKMADYVAINLSSPNTPGLRDLQFGEPLRVLLNQLCEERALLTQALNKKLPLLIKLAPDMDASDLCAVADLAQQLGIDGLIISNTTVDRSAVANHQYGQEQGGLSGAPVFEKSTLALKTVADHLGADKKLVLVGVGGIDSGEKACAKIQAGADLVQLYSGMVYRGPGLVGKVAKAIKAM